MRIYKWFVFTMMCLPLYGVADAVAEKWQASWIGALEQPASNQASSQKAPKVVIKKALYGEKGNPAKQVDLTKKVQQAVAAGKYRVIANNGTAGRDPAEDAGT
jgi:hypothetical protein